VRITGLNHVSIQAVDLEASARFYEEVLGCTRIPSPDFEYPVAWFQLGALQLHLYVRAEPVARSQHFAVDVVDLAAAHDEARRRGILDGGPRRLPDGAIQLYIRDPAGNRVELDGFDDSLTDLPQVAGPPEATLFSGRPRP
jgi:catechol 2,3-dioxygenase-like lactoylglutathione lyase family enzyme